MGFYLNKFAANRHVLPEATYYSKQMAVGEATEDPDKTMCDEWMVVRDEDWIHNNLSAFASQHVHLLVLSSAGLDPFQTLRFNVPNLNIACGLVTRFCRLLSLCETNRTLYSTVARRVENYINYGHSVDRGCFHAISCGFYNYY